MPWHAGLGFGQRHGRRCQLACQLGPLAPSATRCNFEHPFEDSRPRELSRRRLQCYTPARACSDTHSTDRNRTGSESNFPFTRLYSGSYAWPLLCTEIQFLKQNRAPHVVEAWACVNSRLKSAIRLQRFGEEKTR